MSAAEILERIRDLPPDEQRGLVEQIVQEFSGMTDGGEPDLSPGQIAELDRRAERALAHPERCRPFDEVFGEIEARFRDGK